jgi:GT2 family glycosyltransferase
LADLEQRGVVILPHPFPFNYPAVNNRAAEIATGEFVCLLNNDIEILSGDWLKKLVSQAVRTDIGVVGAKLIWPNKMVQHGGVIIGINGVAAHSGNNLQAHEAGYLGLNQISHKRSAVTAACMLLGADLYRQCGGMDEQRFPIAFNDVDLCLRIGLLGHSLIWEASAELVHAESASRGKDTTNDKRARARSEQQTLLAKWMHRGFNDLTYHPALSADYLTGPYSGLAIPPRRLDPRDKTTNDRVPAENLEALHHMRSSEQL